MIIPKQCDLGQQQQQTDLQQQLLKLKPILFKLFCNFNEKLQQLPFFTFYAFGLIQFLQTLNFIISTQLDIYDQKTNVIYAYLVKFLSILNFQSLMKQIDGKYNFYMLILTFIYLSINLLLVHYCYLKLVKKNDISQQQNMSFQQNKPSQSISNPLQKSQGNRLQTTLINICVLMLVLNSSILTIPLYTILLPVFYCTSNSLIYYTSSQTCYDTVSIIACFFAFLSFLMLTVIKLVCTLLMHQRNPLKKSVLACDSSLTNLVKTLANIAIILYFSIDPLFTSKPLYIGGTIFLYAGMLFLFRWEKIGFYNKNYMKFILSLQILLECFCINNIVKLFLMNQSASWIGFTQFIIASCLLAFSVSSVIQYKKTRSIFYFYQNPQSAKHSSHTEQLLIQIIYAFLHETDKKKKSIQMKLLFKQLNQNEQLKLHQKQPQFLKQINIYLQQNSKQANNQIENYLNIKYIVILIDSLLHDKPNCFYQAIRCSLLSQIGLKTQAIFKLKKLELEKQNFIDQYFLYSLRYKQFQSSSFETTQKNRKTTQSNFTKILLFDYFQDKIQEMERLIAFAMNLNAQYWKQTIQQQPDFNYLSKIAKKILENHGKIVFLHKFLQTLFQNSIKQRFLYFSYLQVIQWTNDHEDQLNEFLTQSKELLKQTHEKKQRCKNVRQSEFTMNFQANQKLGCICLDFSSTQGIVKNCNAEIFDIFGYKKKQMINRKIEKIMPNAIAQRHTRFLQQFIKRKDSFNDTIQRVVFGIHKNGYLMPLFFLVKIITNEKQGIKLMGFIKPLLLEEQTFVIITAQEDHIILGVTKQIQTHITSSDFITQLKNEAVYMQMLFPRLKIDKIQTGRIYDVQMSRYNNIERQMLGNEATKFQLRLEKRSYPQNLNMRFYFIKSLQKKASKVSLFSGHDSGRSRSVSKSNTSKIINIYIQKRQVQTNDKYKQLCKFKKNYINKYSQTKYFFGLIFFLTFFVVLLALTINEQKSDTAFYLQIKLKSQKILQLNALSYEVSILTVRTLDMWSMSNETQLKQSQSLLNQSLFVLKQHIQNIIDLASISQQSKIFNLRIINGQQSKIQRIYQFQQSVTSFLDMSPFPQMTQEQFLYHSLLGYTMLNTSINLLKNDIKNQLGSFQEDQSFVSNTQIGKVTLLAVVLAASSLFVIITYLALRKVSQFLQVNIYLLNNLSKHQVNLIVGSFSQYIKLFISDYYQSGESIRSLDKFMENITERNISGVLSEERTLSQASKRNKKSDDDSATGRQFINEKTIQQAKKQKKRHSSHNNKVQSLFQREQKMIDRHHTNKTRKRTGFAQTSTMKADIIHNILKSSQRKSKRQRKQTNSLFDNSELVGLELSAQINEKKQALEVKQTTPASPIELSFLLGLNNNLNNPQVHKRSQRRVNTLKKTFIKLSLPSNTIRFIMVMIVIGIIGGTKFWIFLVQKSYQQAVMLNNNNINKLIQVSNQLMYLRVCIKPYLIKYQKLSQQEFITKQTLQSQIMLLQKTLTQSFPQLDSTQLTLKNIYRHIQVYLNLLKMNTPPVRFPFVQPISTIIFNLEDDILLSGTDLKLRIQGEQHVLNANLTNLRALNIIQFSISLIFYFIFVMIMYFSMLWKMNQTEKTTYQMIGLLPLKSILQNKNIYNAIKNQQI